MENVLGTDFTELNTIVGCLAMQAEVCINRNNGIIELVFPVNCGHAAIATLKALQQVKLTCCKVVRIFQGNIKIAEVRSLFAK